ncbi:site-specific recombinase, phage integrase family [Yoonia vestfoldensis SKA53]|uniref:Site-specific recombinase, phage integrase family n=1 Tax=Yoonia vestfoldensis SKA53 TaxID=314232 RepID=A3V116_9RHOB|nr:site-specific recombinase, phage integrase family [Yoonia vestfoldensis SKA53]
MILRLRLLSMDQKMPLKLPRYVFRRANGSYRYKRNVPKALREVIPKATVYRQLGESYDEAIRRLPVVHAEIEALFDQERNTPSSVRAKSLVREHLGAWHADVFAEGVVEPEWDITDDFRELAAELEGSTPADVVRQVGSARLKPEPMTLHRVLTEYCAYKCDGSVEHTDLKTRIERIRKDLVIVLGKNRVEWTPLADINRADANTFRDYLLNRMAPNSVLRTLGVIKAAMNHVIIENDLEQRNVFQGIKIKGAGASKDDRLPMSDAQLEALLQSIKATPSLCPAYHPRRQRRPPCRNRRARGKRHRPRGWLPAHPPQHAPPPEDQNVRTHDPAVPQSHSVPQAPASAGPRHRPHLPTICPTKGE